jgi:superfamily II DNA or RNA helicase
MIRYGAITTKEPLFTGAMSAYTYDSQLEAACYFKSKYGDEVQMAIRRGNTLYIPRELCPTAQGIHDQRVSYPPVAIDCTFTPRNDDQATCVEKSIALFKEGKNHIACAPTGWGKCFKKGSTVLLANGNLKKVEDVLVGDLLMGPDSSPRKVLSLGHGTDPMVKITPIGEDPFYVNEDHILSLKCTGSPKFGGHYKGEVVNISVKDYLKSTKTFKHCFKLWRPEALHFTKPSFGLSVHPYIIGLLLGDGGLTHGVHFTTADKILADALSMEVAKFGCHLKRDLRSPIEYQVIDGSHESDGTSRNRFLDELRNLGMCHLSSSKTIPVDYLLSSIEDRLQLLAGLLDSDGYLNAGCFDYVSKSEKLAKGVQFLSRSLGLRAICKSCKKTCTNTGIQGDYFRVTISGDTHTVPTRLSRKKAHTRLQKKNVLVRGFKIDKDGVGEYFGFTLSGDHLYLTGDFWVTHNTVYASYVASQVGQPTIIVVTKQDLMDQWYDAIVNVLKIKSSLVGKVQQDTCDWKGKLFVIAMVHSLVIPDRYPAEMYRYFGMSVFDEVHCMAADTFSRACHLFPAKYRLGLSATPVRDDGKTRILISHIGPVTVEGHVVPMKPKVLVKKTGWAIPMWGDKKMPFTPGRMAPIFKLMGSSKQRNAELVKFTLSAYKAGRRTLLLSDLIDNHLKILFHELTRAGIPGQDIAYYIGGLKKEELAYAQKRHIILGTFAMCSTGTNVPVWDTLVLCVPKVKIKQSVGRILRSHSGKKQPVVLDPLDHDSIFSAFYKSRLKQYYELGAQIVLMD